MKIKQIFIIAMLAVLPLVTISVKAAFVEGQDYERITPALPGGSNGQVEVVELFWYGCPHCFTFEPHIEQWKKSKADFIDFKQMPAIFNNPIWKLHAKAYFTAEILGVIEKVHKPLFDAIHVQRRRLRDKEELMELFELYGVNKDTFKKTFNSFAVNAKVNRAADLSKKYGLDGVPAIIVNGKYRIDAGKAGSYERMLEMADYLADKEK